MGGDAVVGHLFHVAGADLDLDRHAVHAHQHRVQGLVAVGLGDGDVVLELARHRFVQVVDAAQHPVAGVHRVDDDAEGEDVHDLGEALPLGLHLQVDAVEVLLAADDLGAVALLLQRSSRSGWRIFSTSSLRLPRALAHGRGDALGAHRVQGAEAEVLELDAHVVHAQAQGDGGVHLQGLAGDAAALVHLQHAQGAHVVQAVRQLDQDHADVLGHGQGHLLEVLGLGLGLGAELDLGQLADAVDQLGHGVAELGADGAFVDAGVLDDVVQHGRHQALMVHVHVGEDAGDRQRVGDVGLRRCGGTGRGAPARQRSRRA